jgi:hypothetical protein
MPKHMISQSHQHQTTLLLKARHVAAWQLPKLAEKDHLPCRAILPALQRGAVWKPNQVEALWDSLLRGFPIGAFLLTPYQEDRGDQRFSYQEPIHLPHATADFHLLDGQQRCNAITLGFLNSWETMAQRVPAALWVDLVPPDPQDERGFVFRVVTISHPWGYRRNDPTQRVETKHRRDALSAYREANSSGNSESTDSPCIGEVDLSMVWPWDAKAPIPFPFLIEAVMSGSDQVWELLQSKLETLLTYWLGAADLPCLNGKWKKRVQDLLSNPSPHMGRIVDGIKRIEVIAGKTPKVLIPALILPEEVIIDPGEDTRETKQEVIEDSQDASLQQDPIETLFIRVNSAGTPLVGEELIYSILKSIWPDAQRFVEELSTRFMMPSRLVMLLSRLILARTDAGRERAPAPPDVGRFRRLIHGRDSQCPDFCTRLKDSLAKGEVEKLFNTARQLLVGTGEVQYLLPPILASDMARTTPPEAFFIFLVWLDRMQQVGLNPLTISVRAHKRMLGALTALSWFANKPTDCLNTLWKRLNRLEPHNLPNFFSKGVLRSCKKLTDKREIQLIPLIPPDILQNGVEESITRARGYQTPSSNFWSEWNWWDRFSSTFKYKENLKTWYSENLPSWKREEEGQEIILDAWTKLADAIRGKQELVLYAQREYLVRWFPRYDPSSLDQVEDTDRPWDMDHIHPQKYIYGKWNMPRIIKNWHGSIGNLRAWPMEANRADGEEPPGNKLELSGEEDIKEYYTEYYGLTSSEEVRHASFVGSEWPQWKASTPAKDWFHGNYLAKIGEYPSCRGALIQAITTRWVALYREWYETLLVEDLFY